MFADTSEKPSWMNEIAEGAVLMFRFPIEAPEPGQMPKARPCIVVRIEHKDGQRLAHLAYATSVFHGRFRGLQITIATDDGLAAAGLHRPTRVELERQITVRLDDSRFDVSRKEGTPVIGRLTPADLQALRRQDGRRRAALRRAA